MKPLATHRQTTSQPARQSEKAVQGVRVQDQAFRTKSQARLSFQQIHQPSAPVVGIIFSLSSQKDLYHAETARELPPGSGIDRVVVLQCVLPSLDSIHERIYQGRENKLNVRDTATVVIIQVVNSMLSRRKCLDCLFDVDCCMAHGS